MACYTVGHISITNMDGYQNYAAKVSQIVADFGGEYLTRGGDWKVVEGEMKNDRHVVLKWPSREAFETWYSSPEYQAIIHHRLDNSVGDMIVVEGYEG
ncbi:MAG: DUF1330 domain-containing protein [Pseudomonadota bacterium]